MLYNIIFILYFIVHLNIIIKLTWGESHYFALDRCCLFAMSPGALQLLTRKTGN